MNPYVAKGILPDTDEFLNHFDTDKLFNQEQDQRTATTVGGWGRLTPIQLKK